MNQVEPLQLPRLDTEDIPLNEGEREPPLPLDIYPDNLESRTAIAHRGTPSTTTQVEEPGTGTRLRYTLR